MIQKIYHGLFRKRKDVEAAIGTMLPDRALVIFAHGIQREEVDPEGGPSEFKVDILICYVIDRKFFLVVGQALRYYDVPSAAYKQTGFQTHGRRVGYPRETLAALDDEADKRGWTPEYRAAFKNMFQRIVRMLDQWEENEAHYTARSEKVTPLPAMDTPPISTN